jgi:hypothetical protein
LRLNLTAAEKAALVAFMKTLTDTTLAADARFADPFPRTAFHDADLNRDGRISLAELTRMIELFNTRFGSVRTGGYAVAAEATEDGFAVDRDRATDRLVRLARYHAADSDRNGKIGLTELTRVMEFYHSRAGTIRTGAYHAAADTDDGFAPGP